MARQILFKLEVAILTALQVVNACIWIWALWTQVVHAQQPEAPTESTAATLKYPNIVSDYMAALPVSDAFKIDAAHPKPLDQQLETDTRPWAIISRIYTDRKRGARKMAMMMADIAPAFERECLAKGGVIEPQGSEIFRKTYTKRFWDGGWTIKEAGLHICMRTPVQSLGALAIRSETHFELTLPLSKDITTTTVVALRPDFVVTQADIDRERAEQAARDQQREDETRAAQSKLDLWRRSIKPGTETTCGPVLAVKGDLIQLVYYRTREPRWYRRVELWPAASSETCR